VGSYPLLSQAPTHVEVELGCDNTIMLYSDPYFFLNISFSYVKLRLYTEYQLPRLPGSALTVPGAVHYGYKVKYNMAIRWVPTHY
jgi:hypothetical protein